MWRGKIKRKKFSWKLFSSFFRIFSLRDIVLLANFFSRDVRNAFHVSRVPFRENFLFGEINLLMDKFSNCAVGIRILARTSQHGCQIYSILVQRNTLSWIVLHKMFFRKLPDLAEKSSDRVWKFLLVLSKLNPCCLEEKFESFVGKKIVLITSSGNWAIFSRLFPKVFRQVVKTATLELPSCKFDAELFFVFKKCFIYQFPLLSKLFITFERRFSAGL